jgi:hypothetical protein
MHKDKFTNINYWRKKGKLGKLKKILVIRTEEEKHLSHG